MAKNDSIPNKLIARMIANGDEWLTPDSIAAFNECAEAMKEFANAAREAGLILADFTETMFDEIGEAWK